MGLGDDLMITGIVEQEHMKHPEKQIIIGDLKNSKWCFNHALALPLYNDLTFELQEVIINELNSCI